MGMAKSLRLPTLLVVTDNPSIRFWVKKHLDDHFFVLSAEKKQEALNAVQTRLDFIIVDSAFENCDPLELVRALSQATQKNLVPILLITGRLKKSYRNQAVAAGVTHFLSDQLDLEELTSCIETGLKAANARQKTEDLSLSVKLPKFTSNSSLKSKFFLNEAALKLMANAKEKKTSICLLLLQIDRWNELPDFEETVLRVFEFIHSFLRESDVLVQQPEGKFAILLPNTSTEVGQKAAIKLRDHVQKHPFVIGDKTQKITVSIAISSMESSESSFHQMISSAAKALKTHPQTNFILPLDLENL